MQYKWFGFITHIDASTQYATVYDVATDKPVATFNRARVIAKDKFEWSLYDTNGSFIAEDNRILPLLRVLREKRG